MSITTDQPLRAANFNCPPWCAVDHGIEMDHCSSSGSVGEMGHSLASVFIFSRWEESDGAVVRYGPPQIGIGVGVENSDLTAQQARDLAGHLVAAAEQIERGESR